ncbi:MAG: ATP-binding protein, partial [Elusimicrobiota bacterium]
SEGYFLRTGPNSQKMNREELLRFLRAQSPSFFDQTPCPDFRYKTDFSVKAFNMFLYVCGIKPASIPREDLLTNLGVVTRDKRLTFKNAGVLFFAKKPVLFHIQAKITCVLFQGTERVTIIDRKDFDGSVADNVEGAMAFLKRNLPRNPLIAELFFRMDEVEKVGSGIGRIRDAIAAAGLDAPVFAADAFFSISFPLPQTPGHVPPGHGPSEGAVSGPSREPDRKAREAPSMVLLLASRKSQTTKVKSRCVAP